MAGHGRGRRRPTSSSACTAWASRCTTSYRAAQGTALPHLRPGRRAPRPPRLPRPPAPRERRQLLLREPDRRRSRSRPRTSSATPWPRRGLGDAAPIPPPRRPTSSCRRPQLARARPHRPPDAGAARRRPRALPRGHSWTAAPLLAGGEPAPAPTRAVCRPRHRRPGRQVQEADAADASPAPSAGCRPWRRPRGRPRRHPPRAPPTSTRRTRARSWRCSPARPARPCPTRVGELREAVDFLRYYAAEAERTRRDPRASGLWACISPWNFPLAIFTGQIAAALATGNAVLAKPAPQTPLIAAPRRPVAARGRRPPRRAPAPPRRGRDRGRR